MNAMILAAGRGTRLGSVGLATPKVLVTVAGETLLERQLRYLSAQGCDRVVVNAHHLADQIEAFAAAHRGPPEIEIVKEDVLLGTAGGVRNALAIIGSDPFLVLYGDVLIDESLDYMVASHARTRADATLALYTETDTEGKGVVELDEDGRVRSFVEKGGYRAGEAALINAGVYVLSREFVERTTPERAETDFGHDVWPAAIAAGRRLFGHVLAGSVIDVGTPTGLKLARARLEGSGSVRESAGPDA
jgi:NDP-sugar pyrophosphorylase family protein